ncbi:hypothetical protein [Fluviicola sp.]|uniref:hypothetical protein n=1 Tax=Fluviicola sp. TaxID=1917219 RepID=UPI0031D2A25C
MKLIGILILICCSFKVLAQDSSSSKLEGAWILTAIRCDNKLISSEFPDPGPYRWIFPNLHWLFQEEKVYEIDYPCCLQEVSSVSEKGKELRIKWNSGLEEGFSIDFRNDSLILTSDLPYGERYYLIKDGLPVNELAKFIKGYINPVCLYGDWEIPTGEVSVEYDAILVSYPWKLQEQVHVEAKNLHHYWANNRFYLEVDGVKRPFRVKHVSLQTGNMMLTPDKWANVHAENQYSEVWLRRRTY